MEKLIIVSDEKHKEFADYLSQLISMDDDTEEETVGVTDGSVQAVVWLETVYKANAPTVSSTQHILFIGNSKLIKEKKSHMKNEYSDYGITYGWLGRQAVLTVEKVVSLDRYEDFISFAQKYEDNIERLVDKKMKKANAVGVALSEKEAAALVVPMIFAPIISLGAAIPIAKKITLNAKIEEQMYSCATRKFYLESLNKFLGLE